MNFLALDFETANYSRASACAVGLARVENNKIVDNRSFLIRPASHWFAFSDIHGITWEDVRNEPTFRQRWEAIEPYFEGIDFAVAHNARFDRSVLRACCESHNIIMPTVEFRCTMKLSRQVFGLYPTTLPAVCSRFKIPLRHHDAFSDTVACASIMMRILNEGR